MSRTHDRYIVTIYVHRGDDGERVYYTRLKSRARWLGKTLYRNMTEVIGYNIIDDDIGKVIEAGGRKTVGGPLMMDLEIKP